MKNEKNRIISIILIIITFHLHSSLQAQDIEKSKEKLKHDIKVIVRLLEVYVTDKNGDLITDLTPSEFFINCDGKPKPISYFEKRKMYYELSQDIKTDRKIEKTEESFFIKPSQGRKIFLFFDFAHNTPRGILRAKEAALHFIDKQISQEDLIGVLSYSLSKKLRVHEFLTKEHKRVRNTIEKISIKDISGGAERYEVFELQESNWGETPLGPTIERSASKLGELTRKNMKYQLLSFCEIITNLAKSLRTLSGYKHILLFSVGPYSDIIYGENYSLEDKPDVVSSKEIHSYFGDSYIRYKWETMAKELASSNCIIYSLNTEGIESSFSLSKGYSSKGEPSLLTLSKITGGKYYPNTNDLKPAVEDISKRTSFYYVLGFPVKEEMDGKFHKIEVKVKRKGAKVHAPTGYYNPKPFKEYTKYEKFIHLVDVALSERPLMEEVKEIPIEVIPISESMIELKFEIPINEIMPEGVGEIEVVIIFFNGEREIVKLNSKRVSFSSKKEKVLYKEALELSGGAEELRVVIRNIQNGRAVRGVKRTK